MLLLIDNFDSFTYNLVHCLGELGEEVCVLRNDELLVKDAIDMNPKAIVLSPGPSTPTNAGICLSLTKAAALKNIPLMGVCLGHQTIGQAFGGTIVKAKSVLHGKTSLITHSKSTLFHKIPSPFLATRYHSLVIRETDLPKCLNITAKVDDGTIMGIEHKEKQIFGVQFHPESIASDYGYQIFSNFLSRI